MKRRILILFVLVTMIFSLVACGTPQNVYDTGEHVSGTYGWSINTGVSVESSWIFDEEKNTVTNRYYNGLDYVEVTYDYVIGIEDGVKVIRLKGEEGFTGPEYEFDYGRGYVIIAGERYETPND